MLLRPAQLPEDTTAIAAIDTSFDTDTIFDLRYHDNAFTLIPTAVSPPVTKRFPLDDLGSGHFWRDAVVATDDAGTIKGFLATRDERWNQRIVIWHLYVDRAARGAGMGYALMQRAFDDGLARGLKLAWLETSNIAFPSVQWYRRQGFEVCGLDTTRYTYSYAPGETSIFLAREL
jgi:ribosomal protein S18 acetylase RimI-like enzyme